MHSPKQKFKIVDKMQIFFLKDIDADIIFSKLTSIKFNKTHF